MQQRVEGSVRDKNYLATPAAVAAGWTTTRHKLLAPEGSNAVASVTSLHVNLGAINKHPKLKATPGRALAAAQASRTCRVSCLSSSLLGRINADELAASTFVFK